MKTKETDKQVIESMRNYIGKFYWTDGIGYNPTEKGLTAILEKFKENKKKLIELFEKSPHYNGKYQIVLKDETYQRQIDTEQIHQFTYVLYDYLPKMEDASFSNNNIYITEKEGVSHYGITNRFSLLKVVNFGDLDGMRVKVIGHVDNYNLAESFTVNPEFFESISPENYVREQKSNGYIPKFFNEDTGEIVEDYDFLQEKFENESIIYDDSLLKEFEKLRIFYNKRSSVINLISTIYDQYLTKKQANKFNEYFPELKAREGQKTTRVVNKFCLSVMKLKKEKGSTFASAFSSYCDAINPLSTPRWTIISIHPTDFLSMSNGYDWSSCHTLNKMRSDGQFFNGCYSSGTLSYLLDEVSMVFYTVQREYDGNEFETQPKMTRCMFHLGKDKLIQGRVYPQDNDGVNAVYKEIRPVVQRVVCEMLGVPNFWRISKGIDACARVSEHFGTHYPDIINYSNCNVSYYGSSDSDIEKNREKITIGHNPICPRCGDEHTLEGNILCKYCIEDLREEY